MSTNIHYILAPNYHTYNDVGHILFNEAEKSTTPATSQTQNVCRTKFSDTEKNQLFMSPSENEHCCSNTWLMLLDPRKREPYPGLGHVNSMEIASCKFNGDCVSCKLKSLMNHPSSATGLVDCWSVCHGQLHWKAQVTFFLQLQHLDWTAVTSVSLAKDPKYKILRIKLESLQLQVVYYFGVNR